MLKVVIYAVVTLTPVIGGVVTLLVILFGLGASLLADRTPSLSGTRTA